MSGTVADYIIPACVMAAVVPAMIKYPKATIEDLKPVVMGGAAIGLFIGVILSFTASATEVTSKSNPSADRPFSVPATPTTAKNFG